MCQFDHLFAAANTLFCYLNLKYLTEVIRYLFIRHFAEQNHGLLPGPLCYFQARVAFTAKAVAPLATYFRSEA